jgi:hypothetical protein
MKFELSKIKYSRNDVKWDIRLPTELNSDLAYFLGVHLGDGHMNLVRRKGKIDYYLAIHGHKTDEFDWYNGFLKKLIKNLFNKDVNPRLTTKGTIKIEFRSKAIIGFLHKLCGLSLGPKTNCKIPSIITNSKKHIQLNFLRGLADTDFSVTFKKRKKIADYPVIYYQTPNNNLIGGVKEILRPLDLNISGGKMVQILNGKKLPSSYLQISGRKSLGEWMKYVGFSSPKHLMRIKKRGP